MDDNHFMIGSVYEGRDDSVWTKDPYQKHILKIQRALCKNKLTPGSPPIKPIPVKAKLIIYLKKNNKYPNTTYSTECWMHDINRILLRYDKNLILKYSYNGKTYKPEERPFWYV